MTRPICLECDLPVATQEDHDTIAEGGGDHLCWRDFHSSGCQNEPHDWRGECLALRAMTFVESNKVPVEFMGRPISYWLELRAKAEKMKCDDLVMEISVLRDKAKRLEKENAYYHSGIDHREEEEFRKLRVEVNSLKMRVARLESGSGGDQ